MVTFDKIFLMAAILLMQLPQLLSHYGYTGSVKGAALLFVFVLMIVRLFIIGIRFRRNIGSYDLLLFAFVVLVFAAVTRSFSTQNNGDSAALLAYMVCVFSIVFGYFFIERQPLSLQRRIYYFGLGVVAYACANFLMYFVDLYSGYSVDVAMQATDNGVLQALGFDVKRALFPMAYGVNAYGNIIGAAVIFSVYYFRGARSRAGRILAALFILVSIASLIMVESRGAYVAVIFGLFFSGLVSRRRISLFVFGAPLIPFFLFLGSAALVASGLMELISRGASDFSGLVTDRDVIWGAALAELASMQVSHLVGFGAYGNDVSGVMDKYMWIFSYSESSFMTLHNGALQYIFDLGYLGLVVVLLLQRSYFNRLEGIRDLDPSTAWLLKSVMVYLLFLSGTEAVPTMYFPENFYVYAFLLFSIYGVSGEKRRYQA